MHRFLPTVSIRVGRQTPRLANLQLKHLHDEFEGVDMRVKRSLNLLKRLRCVACEVSQDVVASRCAAPPHNGRAL